jgi:hypothetical protein
MTQLVERWLSSDGCTFSSREECDLWERGRRGETWLFSHCAYWVYGEVLDHIIKQAKRARIPWAELDKHADEIREALHAIEAARDAKPLEVRS